MSPDTALTTARRQMLELIVLEIADRMEQAFAQRRATADQPGSLLPPFKT